MGRRGSHVRNSQLTTRLYWVSFGFNLLEIVSSEEDEYYTGQENTTSLGQVTPSSTF